MLQMKETTFMKSIFRVVLPAAMGLVLAGSQAYAQDDTGETAIPVASSSAPVPVALSASDKAWLKRIEQALNQSKTFQARIQQLDAEGKRTTGTVWMKRPGQMRLAYDPPSPLLLVANGGKVVFRDNQLDQTTVIPIERTPLGLLLRPHVSLTDDVTVTGFQHDNGLVQVTLVRTSSPGDGSLTLVFYETPVALRSWSVLDAQGRETRVTLFDVHAGADIPASTFVLPAEDN
ncbi:LolA family protein [Acetobacter pasteurianus]|uniref:LolA family protein n=1 Tax=Acetobacter pasteurianus TaxID=438 RepID=UPI001363DC5C|nr:outer membrane lipoprotein carrier protein LolA [Acetobacter pasteurianus]QHM92273.1 outer membrane lipoprotein carrier protein LolA [Acetobacter pasteurianus]